MSKFKLHIYLVIKYYLPNLIISELLTHLPFSYMEWHNPAIQDISFHRMILDQWEMEERLMHSSSFFFFSFIVFSEVWFLQVILAEKISHVKEHVCWLNNGLAPFADCDAAASFILFFASHPFLFSSSRPGLAFSRRSGITLILASGFDFWRTKYSTSKHNSVSYFFFLLNRLLTSMK